MNILHTDLVNDQRAYCILGSIKNFAWSFPTFTAWKRINTLFTGLGLVRIEKNCALGLDSACSLGPYIQELGHSFSLCGPPSR